MTWASTDIVPGSINLSPNYSNDAAAFQDGITFKVAPVNSTGAKFDFTSATGASLKAISSLTAPGALVNQSVVGGIMVAHDATGLTCTMTAANWLTMVTAVGLMSFSVTLTATDGTTELIVARGFVNANYNA